MSRQKKGLCFVIVGFVLCWGFSAQAGTLYWDGNGTDASGNPPTSGVGDSGVWDNSTTANWWNGTAYQMWNAAGGQDIADFRGTANTVTTAAGGVSANKLIFNTADYIITGEPLALTGILPTITNGVAATINSALTGSAGLTKLGDGTLTLGGDNTGLSGTLTISGATSGNSGGVRVESTAAFGAFTNVVIASQSFLYLKNANLSASVPITVSGAGGLSTPAGAITAVGGVNVVNGPVELADDKVRVSNYGPTGTYMTFNGPITAPVGSNFGLTVRYSNHNGTIFTNTANYWEGDTAVSQGSCYFYPGALPSSSRLLIAGSGGGWFESNGSFTRPLGTTSAGQVNMARSPSKYITGLSARGGDLNVNFGGAGATVTWGSTAGFNPFILGLAGANATGTLTLENPLDLNNAMRTIDADNGTAAVDAVLNGTLSSTGTGGLTKTGTGTLLLAAENTYLGATVISAGVLQLGNGGLTGTLGAGTVTNNASLVVNRNNAYNLANLMVGTGSLKLIGAGTVTLSAANSYSGQTTVTNGTLMAGCDNALLANNALTLSNGAFDAGSYSNALGTLTLTTGTASAIIVHGAASRLSFTNLSAVATGTLVITGSLEPSALRIGTDASGLTQQQRAQLSANGKKVFQDALGYLHEVPPGTLIRIF